MTISNRPVSAHAVGVRIQSVDYLRGLTMAVMIFVNDLAGVKGLPWWTYHVPEEVDAMSYVDVVFPAFLFIVGLSLPLAIRRRLEREPSLPGLWKHVLVRASSLVALGIMLANSSKVDPGATGLKGRVWATLALVGAILFLNVYPAVPQRRSVFRGLKLAGGAMFVVLLILFRRRLPDGSVAWLDFSYWEILGLIGMAYLSACIAYIPFRRYKWAPAILLVLLSGLNIVSRMGWLRWLTHLPAYIWPFGSGALASIVMAGVAASVFLLDPGFARTREKKVAWTLGFAVVLFVSGWLLTPFGISKIRETPTWCLYSSAITAVLLVCLFWIVDLRGHTGWASLLKPAGSNTLLTYLLPDVYYTATGLYLLPGLLNEGVPGCIKSTLFTVLMLLCAGVLTRWKVRLQL